MSEQPVRVAYPRDASAYNRPNTRTRKRLHRIGPDGVTSACGRVVLSTDLPLWDPAPHILCRRCFATPDPATPTRAGLPADRQETSDE